MIEALIIKVKNKPYFKNRIHVCITHVQGLGMYDIAEVGSTPAFNWHYTKVLVVMVSTECRAILIMSGMVIGEAQKYLM
jgi:hypothetical protein